tara:strand:- start:440 stop:823 length:384 start_codon:yes stop_codon:yes gene_type:complete
MLNDEKLSEGYYFNVFMYLTNTEDDADMGDIHEQIRSLSWKAFDDGYVDLSVDMREWVESNSRYIVEVNEFDSTMEAIMSQDEVEWYLIDTNVRSEYESGIIKSSTDYSKLAVKARKLNKEDRNSHG